MPVALCRSVRPLRENQGMPMDVGGRLGVAWAGEGKRGAGVGTRIGNGLLPATAQARAEV